MGKHPQLIRSVRLLLVMPVVALGIVSTIGSDECTQVGGACTSAGGCCSGNCENGICCLAAGESVEGYTDADCCSGQSLDGFCCLAVGDNVEGLTEANCCTGESLVFGDQRFCCAPDGVAAPSPDFCCPGLTYVDGICWACPPGCNWSTTPSVLGEEKRCICPDGSGGEVTLVECPPCFPCAGANPADLYLVRIYSVELHRCMLIEVWAPNPDDMVECAKVVAGLTSGDISSYVIEDVSDMPANRTCEGLW